MFHFVQNFWVHFVTFSDENKDRQLQLCSGYIYIYSIVGSQWRTEEFCWGGGSTNSVEDREQRERGSGGGSPIVRGFGDSCNLVQKM